MAICSSHPQESFWCLPPHGNVVCRWPEIMANRTQQSSSFSAPMFPSRNHPLSCPTPRFTHSPFKVTISWVNLHFFSWPPRVTGPGIHPKRVPDSLPWHISEQSDAGRSEATAATTPLAATNIPCWQQHLRPVTNPPNNGRRFPTWPD